jgi:hypothetical protein
MTIEQVVGALVLKHASRAVHVLRKILALQVGITANQKSMPKVRTEVIKATIWKT